MPSQKMQKFIVHHEFTEADWIDLIEERRVMIKPYLDRFTLKKLGDISCLRNGAVSSHAIKIDNPRIVTYKIDSTLEIQAIWGGDNDCLKHFDRTNNEFCQSKWGLTRSGEWVLAFVFSKQERNHPKFGYYECAERVDISLVDLPELLSQSKRAPQEIWRSLTGPVISWLNNIEPIYQSLRNLQTTFSGDEELLRHLTR